jgi:PhzF family phenazine biosynthesis protein
MKCDMVEKRHLQQYQVDAFSGSEFRGNPAAVVFGMRSDEWMQQLATENNLAETSFIEPVLDADLPANVALYRIRW